MPINEQLKTLMDMKKLILFLTVAFCLLASAQQTLFGQAALRVFMQPDGFQGSAIQYGNNANAGHYVQADDASSAGVRPTERSALTDESVSKPAAWTCAPEGLQYR